MDMAMVGGFGLALAAGIVFLLIDRINRSETEDSRKRLITYACLLYTSPSPRD